MTGDQQTAPDSGGALVGQDAVDSLVRLLDLAQVDIDRFVGDAPNIAVQKIFGGQVAGQALVAAGRTVAADRTVHSLHSYFVRPGDQEVPIDYEVERTRDGRSFTLRRVVARQNDAVIFTLSASFQLLQSGVDHQSPMPEVPDPLSLPTIRERYVGYEDIRPVLPDFPESSDMRYVDDPGWVQRERGPRGPGPSQMWLRANGALPDDPLVHVCALTFASDLRLLDAVLVYHGLAPAVDPVIQSSLDHAMWFHRPFRADEWLLYQAESPSASGSRGLAMGQFFSQDGRHIASVAQEGLIRVRSG